MTHRQLKDRTRAHYRWPLDDHLIPKFGSKPLASITSDEVRSWFIGFGAATPTVRSHAYGLLRSILSTAASDGKIGLNPCVIRGAAITNAKSSLLVWIRNCWHSSRPPPKSRSRPTDSNPLSAVGRGGADDITRPLRSNWQYDSFNRRRPCRSSCCPGRRRYRLIAWSLSGGREFGFTDMAAQRVQCLGK